MTYLDELTDARQAMRDEAANLAGDQGRDRRYAAEHLQRKLWKHRDRLIADAEAFRRAFPNADLADVCADQLPLFAEVA